MAPRGQSGLPPEAPPAAVNHPDYWPSPGDAPAVRPARLRLPTGLQPGCRLLLSGTRPVRALDICRGQPVVLAARSDRRQSGLASILGPGTLGLYRSWLVLGLRLSLGFAA